MTIIFDLDGTLLNTIDDLGYACNYAQQQGGPTLPHLLSFHPNDCRGTVVISQAAFFSFPIPAEPPGSFFYALSLAILSLLCSQKLPFPLQNSKKSYKVKKFRTFPLIYLHI